MPIYEYACDTCQRTFEAEQRLSEAPLTSCTLPSGKSYLDRIRRFKDTTGCLYGGNDHHDRCVCQTGLDAYPDTPHQHYTDPPFSCARCIKCTGYRPAEPDLCGGPVRRLISSQTSFVLKGSGWYKDGY